MIFSCRVHVYQLEVVKSVWLFASFFFRTKQKIYNREHKQIWFRSAEKSGGSWEVKTDKFSTFFEIITLRCYESSHCFHFCHWCWFSPIESPLKM
jgi:hypothetical protein